MAIIDNGQITLTANIHKEKNMRLDVPWLVNSSLTVCFFTTHPTNRQVSNAPNGSIICAVM